MLWRMERYTEVARVEPAARRSCRNACALWYRSSGDFAKARMTTVSRWGPIADRYVEGGWGASYTCL